MVPAGPPSRPGHHAGARVTRFLLGTSLRRIYWPEPYGATATGFRCNGPRARFDQHRRPGAFPAAGDDPGRGIMYAAPTFACCVAETFGDDGVADPTGARVAVIRTLRPLRLLDIRGAAAIGAGSIAAINDDGARDVTQDWGRYWYEHPRFRGLDGILFATAHNGEPALAVWERARHSFAVDFDAELTDPAVYHELVVTALRLEITVL